MKKILFAVLLLAVGLQGLFADSIDDIDTGHYDARVLGLGTAYTALADDSNALYLNPAGLRRQYRNSMSLRLNTRDSVNGDLLAGNDVSGFLETPQLDGEFLYTTRNWGVGIYSKYFMDISYENDEYLIDAAKYNSVLFGISTGLGPISLGANIKATKLNKSNVTEIPDNDFVNVLIPFIQEIILGEYSSSVGDDEQVLMGVGALVDIGNLSLGVYSDEFLDFMYGDDSEIRLDIDSILEGLDVGIAYQSDTYDSFGNFKVLQFAVSADVHDLGDDTKRSFAIGSETNLRFFEYMQLALRLGYQEDLDRLDDLMFGLSMTEGDYSAGLGVVLPFMKLDAGIQVPADALLYMIDSEEAYTGDKIEAQLSFGFAL